MYVCMYACIPHIDLKEVASAKVNVSEILSGGLSV